LPQFPLQACIAELALLLLLLLFLRLAAALQFKAWQLQQLQHVLLNRVNIACRHAC
jgi:hypothetical protein